MRWVSPDTSPRHFHIFIQRKVSLLRLAHIRHTQVWTETGPFHVFIARDFNPQAHCEISVGPAKAWRLLNNAKDDITSFTNMSYYVRSIGALVGCEHMGRGSRCQVWLLASSSNSE
jgi:hypothetical protein